mgnify:FL=1
MLIFHIAGIIDSDWIYKKIAKQSYIIIDCFLSTFYILYKLIVALTYDNIFVNIKG